MNENISFLDGLMISLSSIVMVLVILYLLSLILDLFRLFFTTKEQPIVKQPVVEPNDHDKKEKLVAALTATIIAGQNKPNAHFRISKITRIK